MAKKKARRKAKRGGRKPGPKPGSRAVRQRAQADVGNVVQNLKTYRQHLESQRAEIDEQIAALDKALGTFGAAPAPARRGRPPGGHSAAGARPGSLKDYITQVLSQHGGTMAVKDIADEVLAAGYPTKNKTLAKSVGIALTQMPNVKKVGRGQFTLK